MSTISPYTLLSDQIDTGPFDYEHNSALCGMSQKQLRLLLKQKEKGSPMIEIRRTFVSIALLVILAGLMLTGMGPSLTANTTSGLSISVPLSNGMLTGSEKAHFELLGICPDGKSDDC
jgi:hypothetical protein